MISYIIKNFLLICFIAFRLTGPSWHELIDCKDSCCVNAYCSTQPCLSDSSNHQDYLHAGNHPQCPCLHVAQLNKEVPVGNSQPDSQESNSHNHEKKNAPHQHHECNLCKVYYAACVNEELINIPCDVITLATESLPKYFNPCKIIASINQIRGPPGY